MTLGVFTALLAFVALRLPPSFADVGDAYCQAWARYRLEQARPRAEGFHEQVLASLDRFPREEWTGSYKWSNGRESTLLDLGPDGFFLEAKSCFGTTEIAYGKVISAEGERIRLDILEHVVRSARPRRPERRADFRLSDELYSVRWTYERFLVPAELMVEFCTLAKADGWSAMKYADYPRKNDLGDGESTRSKPLLVGLPAVPGEFGRYLPD